MTTIDRPGAASDFMASKHLSDYEIRFVFRRVGPVLRARLKACWEDHKETWITRTNPHAGESARQMPRGKPARPKPLRNVACVAFEKSSDQIVGFAWVSFQRMPSLNGGFRYSYFQKLFILPEHRSFELSSNLLKHFLLGMSACKLKSPLATSIVAINSNKRLLSKSLNKYFARLGFCYLGINPAGSDIWERDL
jgi:hypothetical protein